MQKNWESSVHISGMRRRRPSHHPLAHASNSERYREVAQRLEAAKDRVTSPRAGHRDLPISELVATPRILTASVGRWRR